MNEMSSKDWWGARRVCVTGGAGFLGSYVVARLRQAGCANIFVPRSAEFDLRHESAIRRLYDEARPDTVVHLAAVVGGIGADREKPRRFFYENLIISTVLMEEEGPRRIHHTIS